MSGHYSTNFQEKELPEGASEGGREGGKEALEGLKEDWGKNGGGGGGGRTGGGGGSAGAVAAAPPIVEHVFIVRPFPPNAAPSKDFAATGAAPRGFVAAAGAASPRRRLGWIIGTYWRREEEERQ